MIDVAISSCARIDILSEAVNTFLKYVKTKDKLRLIICEDRVDDVVRQRSGRNWIEDNADLFNKIIYSNRKLTYVYCFSEVLKYVESPYFFRLEDDVIFHEEIDIDKIIEFMSENSETVSQLIFRRKKHNLIKPQEVVNDTGREINLVDSYSIATGIFNLELTKKIVGLSGTEECHESSVLAPAMRKLGLKSGVISGVSTVNALDCVGDILGYKKGSWKKVTNSNESLIMG